METLRGPPLRYNFRGLVSEPNPLCQAIHSAAPAWSKAMPRPARGLVYRHGAACPDGGFAIVPGHTRGIRRTKRFQFYLPTFSGQPATEILKSQVREGRENIQVLLHAFRAPAFAAHFMAEVSGLRAEAGQ